MKRIGKWEIVEELGQGGNGIVYLATDGLIQVALKTLKKFSKTKDYARFQDEIKALQSIAPMEGIMPILEACVPENPDNINIPYYTMPVAESKLDVFLKSKSHEMLYGTLLDITKSIIALHEKGFTHRDIKPSNILIIDGKPVISDFGLVSFPNKKGLSGKDENIGPFWTIAPEMKRTSSTAEYKKADIYSLAKTLWILVTSSPQCFEGQYVPHSSISLDNYIDIKINTLRNAGEWNYFSILLLEQLLIKATDNNPQKRPTAQQFYDELSYWLISNSDYELRNPYEWEDALKRIFPYGVPMTCEWSDSIQILKVLEVLTDYDNLNHCFIPPRGGHDLKKIKIRKSDGYFIFNDFMRFKPIRLIFHSPNHISWSYFRIVISPYGPILDAANKIIGDRNELHYRSYIKEYTTIKGKRVLKILRGSIIIVQKASFFNRSLIGNFNGLELNGYSGIHEKIPYEEYDAIISYVSSLPQK